jgi:hypothetical protein
MISMVREELPLPWNKSLLAISPGLLATVGLVSTDFSVWMLVGLILLVAFLVSVYWWNNRQLPGWSLMAAGMLTSVGLIIVSGVIGGLTAIMVGRSANTIVLLILLAILTTLLGFSMRTQRVSLFVWVLITLIILCQLAVRLKYFVLLGVSWSVAGQWLNISLYAAVIALLLPVAFGQLLAKRHGLLTMLFAIGMIYVSFQILIDVNYKVSDQIGDTLEFVAYKALIPFLFTVIAPLWFLRARSSLSRVGGMLTLVGLAVIIDLIIIGLSYGGKLDLIIWFSFIPYTISVLLGFALAYLLYRENKKRPTQVAGRLGFAQR